ncbi:MAG: hypothetical protein RLP44_09365 [Aggregatilineales bacterium]
MAKRKDFRNAATDPFGSDQSDQSTNSVFQTTDEIYGTSNILNQMGQAEARHGRITNQDIFKVIPDPQQPRRTIPHSVRNMWDGDPTTLHDMFAHWLDAIAAERGREFPLDAYLLQDDELLAIENETESGPLEAHFIEVINLAVSIRQEGLANPISIIRNVTSGDIYRIETGERRWLSYHLLYLMFQGQAENLPDERTQWSKIPARRMDEPSVWRQAAENNARQNLNAIGRARQFAILMMDLWETDEKDPREFARFESFNHEQEYYRQAANLSTPYGKNNILLSAMGFKNRATATRYRELLNLPSSLWDLADDMNCPEGVLRNMVKLNEDDAIMLFEQWLKNQNVTSGDISGSNSSLLRNNPSDNNANRPTLLADPACKAGKKLFSTGKKQKIGQNLRELIGLHDGVGQAAKSTKSQIRQMMDDLRRVLDEIESSLDA